VLAAIVALWLEWLLYYSARGKQRTAEAANAAIDQPPADSELLLDLDEREEAAARKTNFVGR
jgi:hypothetical protein